MVETRKHKPTFPNSPVLVVIDALLRPSQCSHELPPASPAAVVSSIVSLVHITVAFCPSPPSQDLLVREEICFVSD